MKERTFRESLKVFAVKGGNRGAVETVIATTKEDAIEASDIREMGPTTAIVVDDAPLLREALSGVGEPMGDIEWYDRELDEWSFLTVSPSLYDEVEAEILVDSTLS